MLELRARAAEPGQALRVVVADDDPLVRRLLRATLERSGMAVIAEAASGGEAVERALAAHPDIVVMDYLMPGMDGVEAARRIHAYAPSIPIVVLTGVADEEVALQALRAGAVGHLSKDIDLDALPRTLRAAVNGQAAISRRLAMTLIEHDRALPAAAGVRPVRSALTDREWQVLDLLATGSGPEQIADALVLSGETVRSHLKNLYRKLGVHSRAGAVAAAADLRTRAPATPCGSEAYAVR